MGLIGSIAAAIRGDLPSPATDRAPQAVAPVSEVYDPIIEAIEHEAEAQTMHSNAAAITLPVNMPRMPKPPKKCRGRLI